MLSEYSRQAIQLTITAARKNCEIQSKSLPVMQLQIEAKKIL